MPPGLVTIILVSIIAGMSGFVAITKIIVNHLERRRSLPEGSSMTQSELRSMIASAVEEATAPIVAEVATLQKQLAAPDKAPLLPEHRDPHTDDS
ncbi:MAG: hypothetical protein HKN37_03250 [Rhodothermales bacterium]|nr:hypothetical protein [Rhodothermales bacterium]